jgi:hypothetical protein
MGNANHSARHARAAELLRQVAGSQNSEQIVESLSVGLNTIRDLLFQRIHNDVELHFGMDSMKIPLSLDQSEYNAKAEIDIWQIVEACRFAVQSGYVPDVAWMQNWLGELRLGGSFTNGPVQQRIAEYLERDESEQRRHFAIALEKVYPEAYKSPLVLHQLMPHAVRIVVSVAFGATEEATRQRDHQTFLLPGIRDCQACRGEVLDNGETCVDCGNPIWNYKWLLAAE